MKVLFGMTTIFKIIYNNNFLFINQKNLNFMIQSQIKILMEYYRYRKYQKNLNSTHIFQIKTYFYQSLNNYQNTVIWINYLNLQMIYNYIRNTTQSINLKSNYHKINLFKIVLCR